MNGICVEFCSGSLAITRLPMTLLAHVDDDADDDDDGYKKYGSRIFTSHIDKQRIFFLMESFTKFAHVVAYFDGNNSGGGGGIIGVKQFMAHFLVESPDFLFVLFLFRLCL